ncbi:DUF7446 family protein [Glaesserella parasuis]
MKEIKLGVSPLTNQIYAGHLEKKWALLERKARCNVNGIILCCSTLY